MLTSLAVALFIQTQAGSATSAGARPEDVKTEGQLIAALYDVISGPAGQKRDWVRFRSLFAPKGMMAAIVKNKEGKKVIVHMTPEDYIARSGPYLEKNGFFEKEVKRKVVRGGDMVHIYSDYESRNTLEDKKPIQTGTNSMQIFFDGERWYLVSILWEGK
jgi:hypothetical protein